ncbi:FAD:protein FMN transferase [Lacticaseibacillus sp. GG6-2]
MSLATTKRIKITHGLGTTITLTTFGETSDSALDAASALIVEYEDRLTVNRPVSEVMAINHAAGDKPVRVSHETYQLVCRAVAASREDFGFNALIGPLVKLWAIGFEGAHVPDAEAIAQRRQLIDPADVVLNDAEQSVFLTKSGMELDLGGIAKGEIADRVADLWRAYGVASGIIDLGGNLLFVGDSARRQDGRWVIGVQDPQQKRHVELGRVVLPACSAVTSGIYERFLIVDGKQYHHLLDSRTGAPLQTKLSGVTVFAKESVVAETEAKRLFFAGAPILGWETRPGIFGAVFVYQDDHVETVGVTLQS